MIRPSFFYQSLAALGIDFYTGVPDSLLKSLCAYITDHADASRHIIAANEGGAVALAAGHHLATGAIPVVYMQNSGEGNAINPLASLTDKEVYAIPLLLLIGWRGKPGVHDEPQHKKQGKVTTALLEAMGIGYDILDKDEETALAQIKGAVEHITQTNECHALIIEKDTFEPYTLQTAADSSLTLSREEAIQTVAAAVGGRDVIVSTTGMTSRELFEYRAMKGQGHERDFLTVGSMGHASQIALGIALEKNDRRVWCLDGDGAAIMHTGSMAIVGGKRPANYMHVIFNNGAHDSVGGQPTVGLGIDFPALAKAVGYRQAYRADSRDELESILARCKDEEGPLLIEVRVKKGCRKDLGRPTTTPVQNKEAFMEGVRSSKK